MKTGSRRETRSYFAQCIGGIDADAYADAAPDGGAGGANHR